MESIQTPLLLIEVLVKLVQKNDVGTLGTTPKKLLKAQKGINNWTPTSSVGNDFKKELLSQLDNRLIDILLPGPALQAAALHPRYRSMDYLRSDDCAENARLAGCSKRCLEELRRTWMQTRP
jgi:hypothetical protein